MEVSNELMEFLQFLQFRKNRVMHDLFLIVFVSFLAMRVTDSINMGNYALSYPQFTILSLT